MEIEKNDKKSLCISEQISISLINETIEKNISENNKFKNEINDRAKMIEKLDYFISKKLIPNKSLLKFEKFLIFTNIFKDIKDKSHNDKKEKTMKNKAIFSISICFLRININHGKHHKIMKYITTLIILVNNGDISINNFFLILEILLISIIETLKKKSNNQFYLLDIKEDPLLFINDIIEAIINFPNIMLDYIFIENLINLFNTFIEKLEKLNIFLKEDEVWLKLLEYNSINDYFETYKKDSYQNSMKKIIELLTNIYCNNIPKGFYNIIFKKSSIDVLYHISSLSLIKQLMQKEISQNKKIEINKGAYLLGNNYIKDSLSL